MGTVKFPSSWSRRGVQYQSQLTVPNACAIGKLNEYGRHLRQYRLNNTDLLRDACAPRAAWYHALIASPWRVPYFIPATDMIAKAYANWEPGKRVSLSAGARALVKIAGVEVVTVRDADEIMLSIVRGLGPVVLGMAWTEDMDLPDLGSVIHATGDVIGGHAVCVTGGDMHRAALRLTNNRGLGWGQGGRAWIALHEVRTLIRQYPFEAFVILPSEPVLKTPRHGHDSE